MLASYYREKGNRIQNKKKRACYLEEIAHHQISCPRSLKFGQAVENVESIKAFLLDNIMYIYRKCLKSVG